MTSGAPDYLIITGGRTPERGITYSQVEAAIVMFDDFEATTLHWGCPYGTATLDSSSSAGGRPSVVFNGNCCLKLVTEVSTEGEIFRYLPVPEQVGNIGISFYFRSDSYAQFKDSDESIMLFRFWINTGNKYYSFMITANPANDKLYYSNNNEDSFTEFGSVDLAEYKHHFCKLVVDLTNAKAKYLLLDGARYDLSNINLYFIDGEEAPYMYVGIKMYDAGITRATLYIDDYKVTYNEPV